MRFLICLASVLVATAPLSQAETTNAATPVRQMERLGRGLVAVPRQGGGCVVTWRFLTSDPADAAFDVFRTSGKKAPAKVNASPLKGPTFLIDKDYDPAADTTYSVRFSATPATPQDARFQVPAGAPTGYIPTKLETPEGYAPNDASVGDLDGDGEYEIVLHQAGRAHDNSHAGETDPPIFQAYKLNGKKMWEINLGKNIRDGAHYTQFLVYDFDGDGRAEFVCKTADGTVDGTEKVMGDPEANYVNGDGKILAGPEYLTVFDGGSGAELQTVPYIPPRHPSTENPTGDQLKEIWGDAYGNRNDRFLACVAYLDGVHPSIVMCRGYYTRAVLAAWNWKDGKLEHVWTFDSAENGNGKYSGQGNHNLSVADVDGDGKDEIIYGSCAIDDDGKGLYSTGLGHGDALHLDDHDPKHPGLEVFAVHEGVKGNGGLGTTMRDAKTGKVLWSSKADKDTGRGVAFDIDPRYPGSEAWASNGGDLYSAEGKVISNKRPGSMNFAVWWDGDKLRELLDRNHIDKWDPLASEARRLLTAEGCDSNNGTKATPCLSGDLVGDWREEVLWRTTDNQELRLYVTPYPTEYRMVSLMQDPQYRLSIAWQNVAYNQPPHTGLFLGEATAWPDSKVREWTKSWAGTAEPPPPAYFGEKGKGSPAPR